MEVFASVSYEKLSDIAWVTIARVKDHSESLKMRLEDSFIFYILILCLTNASLNVY